MIVEMRTYTLKPNTVPAVEAQYAISLPDRVKLSPLGGFFHTEVGTLNQVIHMWQYADVAERARIREEAGKHPLWPPKISEYLMEQETKILLPAPFNPPLEPRKIGNIYEIRTYMYQPGSIPHVLEQWGAAIEARQKLSPFVGAWYTELGPLNQWTHIWAYESSNHRMEIRAEAIAKGVWPPPRHEKVTLLKQENALVIPAAFSPLH
jgi:hypothetical protein